MSRSGACMGLVSSTALVVVLAAACGNGPSQVKGAVATGSPADACSLFPAAEAARIAHAPVTLSLMDDPVLDQPDKYRCMYSASPEAEVSFLGIRTARNGRGSTDEAFQQIATADAAEGGVAESVPHLGERAVFQLGIYIQEVSLLELEVPGGIVLVMVDDVPPDPTAAIRETPAYRDRVLSELEATAHVVLAKSRGGASLPQ